MLTSGDVVDMDLGHPTGSDAGFRRPAVVVTAQRVLDATPTVVQVVPLTSAVRGFASEVVIDVDSTNGLDRRSAAQCQHIRAVAASRANHIRGNVGSVAVSQIRDLLGLILDIPS